MNHLHLPILVSTLLIASTPCFGATRDDQSALDDGATDAEVGEELIFTLRVPLTSPLFAETPVAVVDEEPITVRDLTRRIFASHTGMTEEPTAAHKDYAELLKRVITAELIVQEARNIGLDELPEVADQIESKSTDLLIGELMSRHLATVTADPKQVETLYRKLAREFLMTTVTFAVEDDATAFKEQCESGGDFGTVLESFIEERRAERKSSEQQYVKLKDLLPRVAQAAYEMEPGATSDIFSSPEGFIIFRIDDVRFYEDPEVEAEARRRVLEPMQRKAAVEYAESLEKKYATIDERLLRSVDFGAKKTGFLFFRKEEPVDFEELMQDERVVATVHSEPPFTITIGDLAAAVSKAYFHGIETAIERKKKLNEEKRTVLKNILFRRTLPIEARAQGLDQTKEYRDALKDFSNSLLFNTFVAKAIAPDVKISEEEVRQYYEEHKEDYSSPRMMRMNGLVFGDRSDAEAALRKIRKGADFKWVSANSPGQVPTGTPDVFDLDHALLSATAMPEGLQKLAADARRGDTLLYSDPKGIHYVITIENVFPETPQPYEAVRAPIARVIAEKKTGALIEDWSEKLREVYETRIFVTGLDD